MDQAEGANMLEELLGNQAEMDTLEQEEQSIVEELKLPQDSDYDQYFEEFDMESNSEMIS